MVLPSLGRPHRRSQDVGSEETRMGVSLRAMTKVVLGEGGI